MLNYNISEISFWIRQRILRLHLLHLFAETLFERKQGFFNNKPKAKTRNKQKNKNINIEKKNNNKTKTKKNEEISKTSSRQIFGIQIF